MADLPILFSAPMVRALIDGRKTQTRRIWTLPTRHQWEDEARGLVVYDGNDMVYGVDELRCRYAVGDHLYVREAWRTWAQYDDVPPRGLAAGTHIAFEASNNPRLGGRAGKFRQGMHMPRWASRLTLIVSDVRVQRLQEISEADAIAEGCLLGIGNATSSNAVSQYGVLWDSLNADRGFGWDANPWVAAYTFTVQRGNINQLGEVAS